ncbi:MAG: MFS transporter [Rhodobacteraceae bacterium]|nr:MFS transporter [Paracoccaceae bacterium]
MNPVWLLMCSIGIVGSNSLVLSPIAADVAASFPARSAPDVMMASAVYGAGTALSALVLAPRADRIGLRRALFRALAILAAALALSALAPVLAVLVIAQALAGVAAGLALPAVYGLAAEVAPRGRESETLGKVLTGWTLSLVAGVSLSAVLADVLHWRAVFALLAAMSLLVLIALHRSALPEGAAGDGVRISPLAALRIRGLAPILLAVAGYMMAFYGLYAFLGTHLTARLGLTTTVAGLAALSYGLGFGLIAPLDRLIDRHGAGRSAPLVFAALLCVYLGLALAAPSGLAILAVCLLWGGANHLGLNILVGQLTALSPARRATILGLYGAVSYGAMFLGTALFKPVFEASGFAATALLSALCLAPTVIGAAWRGRRALQPELSRATETSR